MLWFYLLTACVVASISAWPVLCSSRVAFYGVYDGHAGPKASKFAAEHLHINIRDGLPKGQSIATIILCQFSIFYGQIYSQKHNICRISGKI